MSKKKDDDIQVINRDYQFDFPLSPFNTENNEMLSQNDSQLIDNQMNNLQNQTNRTQGKSQIGDDVDNEEIEEINTGLTPMLNGFDDEAFNNQLVTQPKLYSNLPPLPPLSESVLPNNFNFNLSQPTEGNNGPLAITNNPSKPVKKKDNGPKTRPAFVMKIWSMVNDEKNNNYIRWDDDGNTFQVFHTEEFMKNILPKYFKHNRFASFVRQLNMYGWHKVQDINNGILKDDKSIEENWKFENPYFKRGREDLLDNIVRNKSINQQENEMVDNNQNLKSILSELESIKMNQIAITEDLRRIRKDNKTLWQENFMTRDRHTKQAQTIDKILKFLASVYGQQNKILEVEDLDLNSIDHGNLNNTSKPNNINTTHSEFADELFEELPSSISSPKPKPRLMLMNQAYKTPSTSGSISGPTTNSPNNYSVKERNLTNMTPRYDDNEFINGLEQNIYKQGQSIQQVQDWIQKLSNQQQQLQIQQNNIQNQQNQQNQQNATPKFDLDFDVNDFLHQQVSNNDEEEFQPKRKKFKTDNIEELENSQIKELN